MPEGVFGRAVRRACASVAFPHPSSYGCIVWVREACRCNALPWVVWGVVCTLRRSWRSWWAALAESGTRSAGRRLECGASARVTGGRRRSPSPNVHFLFCLAGWWAAAFGLPTPISRARLSFVSHSNRCSADCISPSVRESSLYDNSTRCEDCSESLAAWAGVHGRPAMQMLVCAADRDTGDTT